jgi:hypothetical protein
MKRLPTLFYEHTSLAVIATIEEMRAKLRAKRQESVICQNTWLIHNFGEPALAHFW